jgi:hypothetical protein
VEFDHFWCAGPKEAWCIVLHCQPRPRPGCCALLRRVFMPPWTTNLSQLNFNFTKFTNADDSEVYQWSIGTSSTAVNVIPWQDFAGDNVTTTEVINGTLFTDTTFFRVSFNFTASALLNGVQYFAHVKSNNSGNNATSTATEVIGGGV